MRAFMIFRGDKPLVWSTDADTEAHTGVAECFPSFPSREIANRVMAAVGWHWMGERGTGFHF